MTDIVLLARKLYERIEWQRVPDTVTQEDLTILIADAIRHLYVMTGRALMLDESMFVQEDGMYISFSEKLPADECEYVILTAELAMFKKVQTTVNDLTSYSTDAMTVTHGDKPYANLAQTIANLDEERLKVWYKMYRYHLL